MFLGLIEQMAGDLRIFQFEEESTQQYICRIVYSAMASWIKTIALDQPPGDSDNTNFGVSRRHMFERSRGILDMMCKIHPEIQTWFEMEEAHPVLLLRTRLLNHGDLINVGFKTNLGLRTPCTVQIAPSFETLLGKTIDMDIRYVGIATIRDLDSPSNGKPASKTTNWFDAFIKNARWSSDNIDLSNGQYFNPAARTKNLFTDWQDQPLSSGYAIELIRKPVNINSFEYYLFKPNERLVHKLDPFLQQRRYHTRIMIELRRRAKNPIEARAEIYPDHVLLTLNALLPTDESIVLESYAWPFSNVDDKQSWIVDRAVWDFIQTQICSLGIQIMEEKHG